MAGDAETDRRATFVAISSGKGGVGKTTVAINLGIVLARSGHRVLVIDGDLGLANVDLLLNAPVQATLHDVVEGRSDLMSTVIEVRRGLSLLPASSGVTDLVNPGPDDRDQLRSMLQALGKRFDLVLVDTAAGIGPSVLWFNSLVDVNLVILTPDPTSVTDAYALIKVLFAEADRRKFLLAVNCAASEEQGRRLFDGLVGVARRFLDVELELASITEQDERVSAAVRRKAPFVELFPRASATRSIETMARRVGAFVSCVQSAS